MAFSSCRLATDTARQRVPETAVYRQSRSTVSGSNLTAKRPFPLASWSFPGTGTMAALRQVGVLDEVIETTAERVAYPAGLEAKSAWVSNGNDGWRVRNGR